MNAIADVSRPILRWHGGKWRLAPWVMSHFPPHKVYVEPFGGSAAVLLQKRPVETEIYNDRDGEVVGLFRVLRDRPDELAGALALTPYARDEYDACYADPVDDLDRARAFVARSFMGMNSKGALEKSGFDTRVNPDGFISRLSSLKAVPAEIAAAAARFAGVVIENCDAVTLMGRHDRPDCLFYVDPPYVAEKRSGKYYRHEMDAAAHGALLTALCELEGMVVLSGYENALYDRHLTGWQRVEQEARTDGNAKRTEVLWINPQCAAALNRPRQETFL